MPSSPNRDLRPARVRTPHHQLELADVWVDKSRADRRARRPKESQGLAARVWVLPVELAEGGFTFDCGIRTRLLIPLDEGTLFEIALTIKGRFVAPEEVEEDRARRFARANGLILLWPYARTYCHELARLGGVTAPPLPLLVRTVRGGRVELPAE